MEPRPPRPPRPGESLSPDEREPQRDLAPLWLMLVVGALPVCGTVQSHERWGAEPTLGLLLMLFALWHLVRGRRGA